MEMSKEEYMHLQHSESIVAQMAATVFAGLAQKQEITLANEGELIERSVAIAIKLAVRTERLVKSDQEWVKKDAGSLPIVG
jgi:PBP1b-binding outer membrane lipoprotein LpoB